MLVVEGFSDSPSSRPMFTNGMPSLVCRADETSCELLLFGKSPASKHFETNEATTIVACFFEAFMQPVLFNLPAAGFSETPVDLQIWDKVKADQLAANFIKATTTADKIKAIDEFLIRQMGENNKNCELIRYATDQIMVNPGTEILSTILKERNLTERTFQRLFKKYVGITPGQYRRICQFHDSFTQVRSKDFDKLADVAYDNGFADQSHFIRAFKEFANTTPNDYLKWGLKKEN